MGATACHTYVKQTRRRITFEWALIAGQNDSHEEALRLAHLLKGLLCHVNVIPLNPTAGYQGQPSQAKQVNHFIRILQKHGIAASVRMRRGIDIDAGCGQLKSSVQKKKKNATQSPTDHAQTDHAQTDHTSELVVLNNP